VDLSTAIGSLFAAFGLSGAGLNAWLPLFASALLARADVVELYIVAVVLGAVTAGSIHAGRATVRPVSTATTAASGIRCCHSGT
jgi:hypothetical protein